MDYRVATEADLDLLAQWNHQLMRDEGHRNPIPVPELRERMREWLAGEYGAVLFLKDGGDPIGYAVYLERPDEIHLQHFFVRRDERRVGQGRQAITILREQIWPPARRLTLEVLCQNTIGLRFWRAMGYQDYSLTLEILPGCQGAKAPAEDAPRAPTAGG
jgi:ribosomal protein S18 acetylase RimI-like enzyme